MIAAFKHQATGRFIASAPFLYTYLEIHTGGEQQACNPQCIHLGDKATLPVTDARNNCRRDAKVIVRNLVLELALVAMNQSGGDLDVEVIHLAGKVPALAAIQILGELVE